MKINLHPTKLIAFLYPLFANDFVFDNFEYLTVRISAHFELTDEQWKAVREHYDFIHDVVITPELA